MNMKIIPASDGSKPAITIEGKNISAREIIEINDTQILVDGELKVIFSNGHPIFMKSGTPIV